MKLSTLVLIILGFLNFVVCNQGAIASETKKVEPVPIQPKNQQNLPVRKNSKDAQNQNSDKQSPSRNSRETNSPCSSRNCIRPNIRFRLPDRDAPEDRDEPIAAPS